MIPTLIIDSTNCITELCYLGRLCNTDKSPYNINGHRHPYTPVYNMLMGQYKSKPIRFAEIGVAGGASVHMWTRYFENGTFYFFDRDQSFLDNAANTAGVERNTFILMDVTKPESVRESLEKTGGNLDILLDDSSHNPDDQYHIIREGLPFVKSGGMIIIEDVERAKEDSVYENILKGIDHEFSFISFILTEHSNKYSPGWNNDKLLVLVKK
jgi:predicted O-methyltransferase YrrM